MPVRTAQICAAATATAGCAVAPQSGATQAGTVEQSLLGSDLGWVLLVLVVVPAVVTLLVLAWRDRGAADAAPADDGGEADPLAFYEEAFRNLVAHFEFTRSEQERSYIEVIGAMVATAHARDHETIGHSFRVARYAVTLGERMGLGTETLMAVEWGALLHDVGKIAVPQRVLHKSGPLTDGEMETMREHPRRGYQMLKGLVFLGTALDVVLSHHERWDGQGYPNGLRGDDIPLSARIFAVVDTYDAITSDRPYRDARAHADAAAELRRVAGTQLDPEVVERFLEIPEDELRSLRDLSRPADSDLDMASHRSVLEEDAAELGPGSAFRISEAS